MIRATTSKLVYRHPGANKEENFPLRKGRARYLRPLVLNGSETDPDEFDIQERLPLEFIGGDEEESAERARVIEEELADAYDGIDLITDDDSDTGTEDEEDDTDE